jgi:thiamine-monophosphate kinase
VSRPLGENALLSRFEAIGRELPELVRVGPGDDLAVLGGMRATTATGDGLLVGADQVVVGRHVRIDEDPFAIGRKAMLRNLSDVAAMAARPLATIATATLDPSRDQTWAERLHAGLHETAMAWNAPLVGGDLATHRTIDGPTVVSVTILAVPALPEGRVVTRSGAVAGDLLAVTGRLGGSLQPDGRGRHLEFEPRIEAAIELGLALGGDLVCMMDLSDGLAKDASRLARMAGGAAVVEVASLPMHDGCDWRSAVGDGEDYELLFACRRTPPGSLGGVPVTVVGRVIDAADDGEIGAVWITGHAGDGRDRIDHLGWEHRGGGDAI